MAEVTPQKNDQLVRKGLGKATPGGRLRSLCGEHGDELVTQALRDAGLHAVTHGSGANGASLKPFWPGGASQQLPAPYYQKGFEAAALRVAATPSFTAALQLQQWQRAGAASRRQQALQSAGEGAHNDAMRAAEARRTEQREREAFERLLAEHKDKRYFEAVEGAEEDTAGDDDMSSEGSERADVEGGDTESGAEVKNADPTIASLARLVLQPSVQPPSPLTVLAPPVAANTLAPPEAAWEDDAAAARPPFADGVELRRLASDNARLRAEAEQLLQEAQAQAEEVAQLRTQQLEQEEARKELQQRLAAELVLAQTEKEAAQTDGADRLLEASGVAKASLEVSELRLELQRTRDELEQAREERGEVHVELEEVKEELEQAHKELEEWRDPNEKLPEGWEEVTDENHNVYYFREAQEATPDQEATDREVTWTRPARDSKMPQSSAEVLELNARVNTLESELRGEREESEQLRRNLEEVREEAEINENRLRGERNEARERLEQSTAARVERRAPPLAPSTSSAPASPVVKRVGPGPGPRRGGLQDNVRR